MNSVPPTRLFVARGQELAAVCVFPKMCSLLHNDCAHLYVVSSQLPPELNSW